MTPRDTAGRAFAAMLLCVALGTSLAQTAPAAGADTAKTNASGTTPGNARVSPHALAARKRAAAQAEGGTSAVRVSSFTGKRRPLNQVGGR